MWLPLASLGARLARLSLAPAPAARCITTTHVLNFQLTQRLDAEPLKKKKRIDPMIIKHREERRRKKIEKQIRRLEKNARQLKPLEELEVPFNLTDEMSIRRRPPPVLTPAETESRALLHKEWTRWKHVEHMADVKELDRLMASQRRALDELLQESEELYDEAIALDLTLVPFTAQGPVATPPIKNYESPDGEYIDVSKKWNN